MFYFCPPFRNGAIAQLVEQRTENPCVPGSIPGGTTESPDSSGFFFCYYGMNMDIVYFLKQ